MGHVTSPLPFALGVTQEDIEMLEITKRFVERVSNKKKTYRFDIPHGYMITTNPKKFTLPK